MTAKEKGRAPACAGVTPNGAPDDGLAQFRQEQSRKCSVHNRRQTDEVYALIRKHRKDPQG